MASHDHKLGVRTRATKKPARNRGPVRSCRYQWLRARYFGMGIFLPLIGPEPVPPPSLFPPASLMLPSRFSSKMTVVSLLTSIDLLEQPVKATRPSERKATDGISLRIEPFSGAKHAWWLFGQARGVEVEPVVAAGHLHEDHVV